MLDEIILDDEDDNGINDFDIDNDLFNEIENDID